MDGGGVGVYVRDDFAVEILATSEPLFDNKPEYLILHHSNQNPIRCSLSPHPLIALTNFYLLSQPTSPISTL